LFPDDPSDISGRMSGMSLGLEDDNDKHQTTIPTKNKIKPEIISDASNSSSVLNMPVI
jgi:hypothetical protein